MSKYLVIIGLIALLILGGVAGWFIKKCPTIKVGKETTLVTITVHDTVQNIKQGSDITVGKVVRTFPKPIPVITGTVDTLKKDTTKTVTDTTVCYSFDEKEKDGTYIKAEMCSDSLPAAKPLDLTGKFTYVAHPETLTQTIRVDTLWKEKKVPPAKDWKNYVIAILAALAGGMIVANVVHH